MMPEQFLQDEPYSLLRDKKQQLLGDGLHALTQWHHQHCPEYARWLDALGVDTQGPARTPEDIPYLTVPLFKQLDLKSIPPEAVFKTLRSSGTTGQVPSRIYLDRDTATLQSKTLVRIMQHWLGKARLPMLIIDHPGVIQDRQSFSARGAGIQGLSFMGRNHCYALTDDMRLDIAALERFQEAHQDGPVFLFGFTFMVWEYFLQALQRDNIRLHLPQGFLLHSGGWKKLQDKAVDNNTFKSVARQMLGLQSVHNFYGMVEQIGSIFVECEHGHLHTPGYADVHVREPGTWKTLGYGETGLLQLLSLVPRSYPGHSVLTEDMGTLLGEDDCPCGRLGKYFRVEGRMKQAEVRGCSDTFTQAAPQHLQGAQA